MKQLIQSLKSGSIQLIDTPIPSVRPGHVLIQNCASIISKGTEETLLEFGRASWVKKIRLQPEKFDRIKAKIKTDGFTATLDSIRTKLDKPISPGYSSSGIVAAIGPGVTHLAVGDRVVSNGPHAEYVCVPEQLCLKIPSQLISFEEAAFTTIASIALQGVRLLGPAIGEFVVVQGLGLIGLITTQILKAQGCHVLGVDFEGPRLELAKNFGVEIHSLSQDPNPVRRAHSFSKGYGADGVIITASTQSSDPIRFAAEMSRQRGKIILVGSTGMQLDRSSFYKKEISFQVSCSYGPGRYEKNYEEKGLDYPIGFVRWTEKRNMEAVLSLLENKSINLNPLISHRFPFESSPSAYELIYSKQPCIGIAISYPVACQKLRSFSKPQLVARSSNSHKPQIGLVGAGDHASRVLLPCLKKLGAYPVAVCSQNGLSAAIMAKDNSIPLIFSNGSELIASNQVDTVVISSRHDSHAELVKQAILANKHIFVEKPLALSLSQLNEIEETLRSTQFNKSLWVGFNRRFSPLSQKIRNLLDQCKGPKQIVYTVNALPLPEDHWTLDPSIGGGRLVSELGHFVDFLFFVTGVPMLKMQSQRISHASMDASNSLSVTFNFEDGSLATLNYCTIGDRYYPKERVEIFAEGKVLLLENFKTLRGYGFSQFNKIRLWHQDKGHRNCLNEFLRTVKTSNVDPKRLSEVIEISKIICRLQGNEESTSERKIKVA